MFVLFTFCFFHRKAIEELQRDMRINKVKRKAFGSVTAPKTKTNRRFLESTLSQCLSHNKRELQRHKKKSTAKLKELDRRVKDTDKACGERKHEFKKPEKRKTSKINTSSSWSSFGGKLIKFLCTMLFYPVLECIINEAILKTAKQEFLTKLSFQFHDPKFQMVSVSYWTKSNFLSLAAVYIVFFFYCLHFIVLSTCTLQHMRESFRDFLIGQNEMASK